MLPEDCLANILDVPPSCSARQTEISKHTEQGCFAGIYVTTKENFFFLFKNNSYTLLYFIYIFFWGGAHIPCQDSVGVSSLLSLLLSGSWGSNSGH